jgi:hypothetical protein
MPQTKIEGLIEGEFRAPHNGFQAAAGSIHNDAVAARLGFKGGTVPGSVHMDQFMPMLLDLYGDDWFRFGDLSLHFTQATVDKEEVKALVRPGEPRARLRMVNRAGEMICTGTASAAPRDTNSELAKRLAEQASAPAGSLRILGAYAAGDKTKDIPLRISKKDFDDSLTRITEPLAIYARHGILPPSHVVRLAHMTRSTVLAHVGKSVGLFGALEVRHLAGPVVADRDYIGRTRMHKLGQSPRTEICWYDVDITDEATGMDVASVTFMLRFMKASSPLWTGEAAPA